MSLNIPPVHASVTQIQNPQNSQIQAQAAQSQPMDVPQTGLEQNMLRLSDYRNAEVQDTPRAGNDELQEQDKQQRNPRYYESRQKKGRRSVKHRQVTDLEANYIINVRR